MLLGDERYKAILPADLYREMEDICSVIKTIQQETAGLVCNSKVPDATAQLNDVLQSTETATHAILDAACILKRISDESPAPKEYKQQVDASILQIYEACTFQDITGQRIKKVLGHLSILDERLTRLSQAVKGYSNETSSEKEISAAPQDTSLSGPQLTGQAPSQTDVDKLFMDSK